MVDGKGAVRPDLRTGTALAGVVDGLAHALATGPAPTRAS